MNQPSRVLARSLGCLAIGLASLGATACEEPATTTTFAIDAGAADTGDQAPSIPADGGTQSSDAATGGGSTVDVTATLEGKTFRALGAAAKRFAFANADGGPGNGGASMVMGEYASMCSTPRPNLSPAFYFYLRAAGADVVPGTYPLVDDVVLGGSGPAPQATLTIVRLSSADCAIDNVDQATTGTVVITNVSGGILEGTFDATLGKNGHAKGSFRIVPCAPSVPSDQDPTVTCVL